MKLIIIEDVIYRISNRQLLEIREVGKKKDEMLLGIFLEENKHLYKPIGVVSFDFRE